MSKREFISRYFFIIKKLKRQAYCSFEEIHDYVVNELELNGEENASFSVRTFQRDLAEIRSLFNIEIEYNRSQGGYFIAFDENDNTNFSRLVEAFEMFQSMNQMESMKNYFHFEKRQPLGTDFINPLIHAIKNRYRIKFKYSKEWGEANLRIVEPLVLKEYKMRWYLVGMEKGKKEIKTFALDRMTDMFPTGETYIPPYNFSAEQYFEHCFGIYRPNAPDCKPEIIVFETNKTTRNYLLSKPLHSSQILLQETADSFRFQIQVFCTQDLTMELLGLGENIKVLQPEKLRDNLDEIHRKCLSNSL